jgi:hypothetical protein
MQMYNSTSEKKVIDQLQALIDFEGQVREMAIEDAPQIQLADDGKQLTISAGGIDIQGNVDRPLVHQIGGRIWPDAGDFSEVAARWNISFRESKSQLQTDISNMFSRHDLMVRYVEQRGIKRIYGIVTPHFVEVNQLEFREAFLEEARRETALIAKTKRVGRMPLGNVVEFFQFDSPGFQVDLEYGLVYAKNTGYDAYKVDWGRYVLVCTNGLRRWSPINTQKWYHTHRVDIGEFIRRSVEDGIGNQRFLEKRIHAAREIELRRDAFGAFLSRLSLAEATKERLTARVLEESRTVGGNEWALSQALTYLGEHDRHISNRTKRQCTDLGTDILEHSLTEVLAGPSKVGKDGFYGLVLPGATKSSSGQARPGSSFPAH